jgi:hypothetical protein
MTNGKGKPYKPPTTGSDATKPTVQISSPSNGTTVSGTVTIQASASDNIGVSSIALSINGSVVGTVNGSAYTFSWNTGSLSNGNYTITAVAKDAAGNQGMASVTVGVNSTVVVLPPSTSLPANFSLVTPPVGNQGYEWTCAPFASAYGARSIL